MGFGKDEGHMSLITFRALCVHMGILNYRDGLQ